jgi:uncharacterized protein YqgC (DUF456 family)
MLYFWVTVLILLNTAWLALVPFALPGNWLIVITTSLFAWWQSEQNVFSIYTLIFITIIALLAEVVEFLGGAGGARKAGARLRGTLGAVAGAIIGACLGTFLIPIPLLGTVLGSCLGAAMGALLLELSGGREMRESINTGLGAGIGQLIAAFAKIAAGFLIWFIVAVAAFWP